jgi:curved DNA-binding protein CbpA
MTTNPFAVLGLPARRDLTDEDVRAAWRRIAAATHPDLPDGGDPAKYSAAAAAYDTLRTSFGRGEALADLGLAGIPGASQRLGRHGTRRAVGAHSAGRTGLSRYLGHVGRAGARMGIALPVAGAATAAIGVAVAGWTPASIALLVGAATWLFAVRTRRP